MEIAEPYFTLLAQTQGGLGVPGSPIVWGACDSGQVVDMFAPPVCHTHLCPAQGAVPLVRGLSSGWMPTGEWWPRMRQWSWVWSCVSEHLLLHRGHGEPAWPSLCGAMACQTSAPFPEIGPSKGGLYSMGAKGQDSPCGPTPDGGYSVRESAIVIMASGWGWSPGVRRRKGLRRHVWVWAGRLGLSESLAPGSTEGRDLGRARAKSRDSRGAALGLGAGGRFGLG